MLRNRITTRALATAAAAALVGGGSFVSPAPAADTVYAPAGGGALRQYVKDATARTWTDAEAQAAGQGGHLASIGSAQENFLVDAIGGGDTNWIGFTDDPAFGGSEFGDTSGLAYPGAGQTPATEAGTQRGEGWVWTDGTPVVYQNWNGGEPNNSGSENYAEQNNGGGWNDLPNGNNRTSVHELPSAFTEANVPAWRVARYDTDTAPNSFSSGGIDAVIAGDATPDVLYYDRSDIHESAGTGRFAVDNPIPGVTAADDNYVVVSTGTLVVDANEAGAWTFATHGDDGSRVRIDLNQDNDFDDAGEQVVLDDALHGPQDSGYSTVNLTAGQHRIEWTFFEQCCGGTGELFAAQGTFGGFDAAAFRLVGDDAGLDVIQAIPEPAAASLLALGGLSLLGRRRRRGA